MLYAKFYFKNHPDEELTVEEFDAVWNGIDETTKEVQYSKQL